MEAFPGNAKIEQTPDGKFLFRPPLKCRDRKSLLRLLKLHDMKGLGGILRDDVLESVPHAEKALKVRWEQYSIDLDLCFGIFLYWFS